MKAPGVSFVVPVHNGAQWLDQALTAILAEDDGRPFEVVVVDDGSTDHSPEIIARHAADPRVRSLRTDGQGAAAAINRGVEAASHRLVGQVDQDVIVQPGWLRHLLEELEDPEVGAAQGFYAADAQAPLWARLAGYDLELRYAGISGRFTDHVCTGNSVYRVEALQRVGHFDESLGYGYDNDMSYRLGRAGYRLAFSRQARSLHRWPEGLRAYLRQQFGLGYGRLDVVARHPRRLRGDQVSGPAMILHVPAMLMAVTALCAACVLAVFGGPWIQLAAIAGLLLTILAADRITVAARAAVRFSDPAALALAPAHLLRDLVWLWATITWTWRRLLRKPSRPWHSHRR